MSNWELVSFVRASEIRFDVLKALNEQIQTPTELKQKFGVPMSRISAILKELSENDLVENLTPERRKEKMFNVTKKGKDVLSEISKLNGGK